MKSKVTLLLKTGVDSDRAVTVLQQGELGKATDTGRITLGDGVRPGGALMPALSYTGVTAVHALAQGKYIFETNGTLTLPNPDTNIDGVYLVYPGEYVKVVCTAVALTAGACLVTVDPLPVESQIVAYVLGVRQEHTSIDLDLVHEVTFILGSDRRWQLT